jgi:hypothetical protein
VDEYSIPGLATVLADASWRLPAGRRSGRKGSG